jgi:hypothetical protein
MVPLFLLFIETVVRHRTSATPIQDRAVSTFPFGPPGEMLRRSGRRRSRLDFGSSTGPFCAFIEVKTHEGWDEAHVARQVAVQAGRTPVRVPRDVRGSVLLAPERVCRRVAARAPAVRAIPWRRLVDELRALPSTSPLTKLAIQPWHGLSVPFSRGGKRGRVGIYKYAEAPPGEQSALETLWLEAYLGDGEAPVAFVKFAPPTLVANELDAIRDALNEEWKRRAPDGGGTT